VALVVASLPECRRQVASLSNSATWASLTTASITASAATLTFAGDEEPFVSTAEDKGKQIVIRGAGVDGADLYTSILSVATPTTATVTDNAATTVSNALCAFGGDVDDDRHSIVEIDENIYGADEEFVTAIVETLWHWARADYLVLSGSIAHGTQLPSHIGTVSEILISKASGEAYVTGIKPTPSDPMASLEMINRWRANSGVAPNNVYGSTSHTQSGSPLSGYYGIDADGYVFYTGADAKARLYQYTRSLTALRSPQVYQSGIIAKALSTLLIKDGDDPSSAVAWAKFAQDSMAAVRLGAQRLEAA
jgi:hypothetical protein